MMVIDTAEGTREAVRPGSRVRGLADAAETPGGRAPGVDAPAREAPDFPSQLSRLVLGLPPGTQRAKIPPAARSDQRPDPGSDQRPDPRPVRPAAVPSSSPSGAAPRSLTHADTAAWSGRRRGWRGVSGHWPLSGPGVAAGLGLGLAIAALIAMAPPRAPGAGERPETVRIAALTTATDAAVPNFVRRITQPVNPPRLVTAEPAAPTVDPVGSERRFLVPAEEALGYAEGRGLSHVAYGMLDGTHCRIEAGGAILWHRERAGGAECRVVLFDGGRLRPGWRIESVHLRLGLGATVTGSSAAPAISAGDVNGRAATLEIGTPRFPARFRVVGEIPLAGARFWTTIERIEVVGPRDARDWHDAFHPIRRAAD